MVPPHMYQTTHTSQQGPLRRIWSLGALGEGSGWDLRILPAPPQAASGNLGFWRSGDLEIQKCGVQKIENIKVLKIKIRSAQNVGKVWISRKKILLTPFGPIWAHFLRGPEKLKNRCQRIFLGGPMGPIHPVWGPCCYPPEVGQ